MKKLKPLSALAVMGLLTALSGNAQQISYAYDSGGNRVCRSIVLGAPTRCTRGGITQIDMHNFSSASFVMSIKLNGKSTPWKVIKQ